LPNRPEIDETFEEIANKSTLGGVSKSACKELDDILKSLEDRFGDKIDYLNLMVKAFSKMVTKENKHLKQFYILIPALSLNCIEHIIRGKEQANKKITTKAFIYDDGFVLGLAYFLTLLKQQDYYKTLHWE
jgi:WASH complex subunit 7